MDGNKLKTSINVFKSIQLTILEIIALTPYLKNWILLFKPLSVNTMYFINRNPMVKVIKKQVNALSVYAEKVKLKGSK